MELNVGKLGWKKIECKQTWNWIVYRKIPAAVEISCADP